MKTTIDNVTVITNNTPRATIGWHDLTKKEQKDFNYLKTNDEKLDAIFIRYRDNVYNLSEFMKVHNIKTLKGWDGYVSDSYFSGVVLKFVEDGNDYVIMGRYYS